MVDMTVHGIGGHGAYPATTKDPVALAARIITGLQPLISRENDPFQPGVITVGSIHGGTKHNIIPDVVKLQLTVRSYDTAQQQRLLDWHCPGGEAAKRWRRDSPTTSCRW